MIPLEVVVDGLHSYRDEVRVPFERLVEEGLFGIFGPTGSGKSTLLDAITLALYGRVDRLAGNEVTPMVNAERDEMTVSFRFRLGSGTYRARRRFVRVDGDAVRQRDAELVDVDGGVALASQPRKVDEQVRQLLGMDFEKFTRAVFLPQGKFAQFLEDDPSDRVKLLEELFGYRRFGEVLRRNVRQRRDDVAKRHTNLEGQLEQLEAYDEETLESLTAEHDEQVDRVEALEDRRGELEPKLQQARELAALLEEREGRGEALARLDDEADTIEALREELAAARAAQTPYRLLERRRDARKALEATTNDLETIETEAEAARAQLEVFLGERAEQEAALQERRESLIAVASVLENLAGDRKRLETLRDEAKALEANLGAGEPVECDVPDDVDLEAARALARTATDGRHLAEVLGDRETQLEERRATVQALETDLASLDERVEGLEGDLAAAEERVGEARAHRDDLVVQERAAVLVEALEQGAPCPVCGSAEHPSPAGEPAAALADVEAGLDEARDDREEVVKTLESARSRRSTLAEQLEEARSAVEEARLARERAREECQARRASIEHEALEEAPWDEVLERARAWTAALEARRDRARLNEVREQLSRARDRWSVVRETLELEAKEPTGPVLDEASAKLSRERAEVDEALEALDEREDELEETVQELETDAAGKRERLETLAEQLETLETELGEALAGTRFDDAEAVEAGYREPERIEAIDERVTAYDEARRDVERDLERVGNAIDAIELTAEEGEAIQDAWEGLEDELAAARTTRDRLAQRVEDHRANLAKRTELEEAYERVDQRLGQLETLHGLLRGRGFVKFLAQARFEQVLEQASQRLAKISGGHYHLQGSPDKILVVDHLAGGKRRDLRTLSGGETFMVSLSLALALSDAIQNERGGGYAQIEFFFLDEGFGSLDRDTLDAVMHLLQDLSDEGVHVGLITHVEAAKRYVPARLEVEPSSEERGSRVRVVE